MAARFQELLAQLAKEHELLLQECEELRMRSGQYRESSWDSPRHASSSCLAPKAAGNAEILVTNKEEDDKSSAPSSPRASTLDAGFGIESMALGGSESDPRGHCSRARTLDGVPDDGSGAQEGVSPSQAESQEEALDEEMPLFPLWLVQEECQVPTGLEPGVDATNSLVANLHLFSLSAPDRSWGGCGCLDALVLSPVSRIRHAWDLLMLLVLLYDIVMLPMQVFVDDSVGIFRKIHLVTTGIWTSDIALSFFTGYYAMGIVESHFKNVAMHYLKGWFVADLAIVSLDWAIVSLDAGGIIGALSLLRAFKVVRLLRFLRILRLVRVLKFQGTATDISSHFRSDVVLTVFGVARSLCYILIASHYIACVWYFAGGRHRPFTWVQVFDEEDRDDLYKYSTSLHWSITQFTPASAEVQPRNSQERILAICVILSGMIAFSCFVSSITQAMAMLQRQHAEESRQAAQMRRFFIENRVSLDMGTRITNFISTHKFTERKRVDESEVVMFRILPDSFRRDLRIEMYRPVLSAHPLLRRVLLLSDKLSEGLCNDAMKELLVKPGHAMISTSEELHSAFYLRSGVGMYTRDFASSFRRKQFRRKPLKISGERWVCETALWLKWRPKGSVTAKTTMQCVTLHAEKFHELVCQKRVVRMCCALYAAEYRLHLQTLEDKETQADVGLQDDAVQQVLRSTLSAVEAGGVGGISVRSLRVSLEPAVRRFSS